MRHSSVLMFCAAAALGVAAAHAETPVDAERLVQVVRQFADTVLERGRDVYGPKHTPLLVDGLSVDTLEPARWRLEGEEWILCNLASQQNLLRTFDGLSRLSGDGRYHAAGVEVTRYWVQHLRDKRGLFYWGGHCFYDAAGERLVGERHGNRLEHELKRHYPYYELLWEVDPQAARAFIEAFWNAHILNWSNLEMNRHGKYDLPMGPLWDSPYEGGPVFFPSRGLSFVNTGSDLFYAAGLLHRLSGDAKPLVWARRMAHRYVETRNPKTGLGGYQYSQAASGDRAKKQLGPEFGDRALEGTLLTPEIGVRKFAMAGTCQMMIGEALGEAGRDFLTWGLEDLAAYAKWAYNPQDNTFRAMLTDGTPLTPADVKRKGYFGPENSPAFAPRPAGLLFFRAYAMAYRLSGERRYWDMARHIARGNGLGELGAAPEDEPAPNLQTRCAEPDAILGLLEIHRRRSAASDLTLARKVAANIIETRLRKGLFIAQADARYAKFDAMEPLALLHLAAALRGKPDTVPAIWPGQAYFHCHHDGEGRTYDNKLLYSIADDAGE